MILHGTMISWYTRNIRKEKKLLAWCADYGLKPLHKGCQIGTLYKIERDALERRFRELLTGKYDKYRIIMLCASCMKNSGLGDMNLETAPLYEIV